MRRITILIMALLLALGASAEAQRASKRLILKDGSYQPAREWKVEGDRVNYFSTERFTWEVLPNELIDWTATDKYNAELTKPAAERPKPKLSPEELAEQREMNIREPLVAPKLRLPDQAGIFLVDVFKNEPQLVELVQNASGVDKQTGKNILRSIINVNPMTVATQKIELKGVKAPVQSHVGVPIFYVRIDSDSGEDDVPMREDRFRLVKLTPDPKKNRRLVADLKIGITGKATQKQQFIDTQAVPLEGKFWWKIQPTENLPPGEYALIEMLSPREMNLYVWDFGVDPNAPINTGQWVPPTRNTKTGTNETPTTGQVPKSRR